jgi:hypothetical protein
MDRRYETHGIPSDFQDRLGFDPAPAMALRCALRHLFEEGQVHRARPFI